jgi:hypothetical protein
METTKAQFSGMTPTEIREKCMMSAQWQRTRAAISSLSDGKAIQELLSIPRPPVINPCA